MKLMKNLRWAVIAAGILSGSALAAAFTCDVTPRNSVITEGQSLQLAATCNGTLTSINWIMDGSTSVTGDVPLAGHSAGTPVYYTTPVGLGGSNTFVFTVAGNSGLDTFSTTFPATVVVKPASAVVAKAAGSATPTTPVNAACGGANNTAVSAMPTNGQQCNLSIGKPALAISGPTSFTWSCVSLTGGLEANCSAVRGFTVTANAGANGSINPSSVGVSSGGTASFTATPDNLYSATISGCGGSQSGNNFTTGPVTANCTVTASFTNAPVAGACGSASNSTVVTIAPGANLCSTGSNTVVASGTNAYTWGCNGSNGGASTSATACQAPRGYDVATTGGANGTISAGRVVAGGTTTTFAVTPASGYAATASGCNGSLSGTTFTTGAITTACSVAASFAVQTVSATDPGVGGGLWIPPSTSGRWIADQSGSSSIYRDSYVPGCLNGGYITTSSSSGCGANASFTGAVSGAGTSTTFAFGSGNILGLRYTSKAGAGSSVKYFGWASGDGGNVGQTVKVWLSDSPTATYDATPNACKATSTRTPYLFTGPGYCPITPNRLYYVFTSTDDAGTNLRYILDEAESDFN